LPSEPTWLPADLIIEFNKLIVAETGEPHVLRDEGALENALAKPVNYWSYGEVDAVVLGVALLVGLGRNHPFLQGNKRTAFEAADYFLHLNGYELTINDSSDLGDFVIDVINGDVSEQRLVETLWDYVEPAA
jgi:death on curing protein